MRKHCPTTFLALAIVGCAGRSEAAGDLPAPRVDLPAAPGAQRATAVFAGGCFWCTEAVFEELAGVHEVVSGYAGGSRDDADYKKVSAGATRHAEAIRVAYDPAKIGYGQLLRVFMTLHDPTQVDGQGPDLGRQYRSAIFYAGEDEKRVAAAYLKQLTDAGSFSRPIVTTLEPLSGSGFFPAEAYHQNYVKLHPGDPYVRVHATAKVKKVRDKFAALVR